MNKAAKLKILMHMVEAGAVPKEKVLATLTPEDMARLQAAADKRLRKQKRNMKL